MATYEILTQLSLANIINNAVANTYTPSNPRKAVSYDEAVSIKNSVASTVVVDIANFINNSGNIVAYNNGRLLVLKSRVTATAALTTPIITFTVNAEISSGGVVTPVLQVSFSNSTGPSSSSFYVTGKIIGLNGTFQFTITPSDTSGHLLNKNYYGNFDNGTVTSSLLGSNPSISNSAYYNLESGWDARIYNGVIRQT